jgi:hypothetical protein
VKLYPGTSRERRNKMIDDLLNSIEEKSNTLDRWRKEVDDFIASVGRQLSNVRVTRWIQATSIQAFGIKYDGDTTKLVFKDEISGCITHIDHESLDKKIEFIKHLEPLLALVNTALDERISQCDKGVSYIQEKVETTRGNYKEQDKCI